MDTIDKINFYLAKTGKTGADLSRALGLSNSIYSQWNTKKIKPSKARLPAIASYLHVSVEDILPDGEAPQKSEKKDPTTDGGEGRSAKKETAPTGDAADERVALFASLAAQLKPDQQEMILRLVKDLLPPRE